MKKISLTIIISSIALLGFSQLPNFNRPCGIYVLGSAQAGFQANAIRSYPFVDGLAMRVKWEDIETSLGVYDFSVIDSAVGLLENNGQKLTLALFLKDPPPHIPLLPNADTYWAHEASNPNDSTLNILPWDTVSLPFVNALLDSLGSHLIPNQSQGGTLVQFRNHPVFAQISVSLPGLGGIRDTDNDITGHPNYDRNKFTNAALNTIQTYTNFFPNQYHYIAFFGISDGINMPKNLKNHLLDEFNLAFNTGSQPLLGYFAENLACSSPAASTIQVLFTQKNTTFTMMQMLESWRTPHQNGGAATSPCLTDSTGPDVGMAYALNNFNTTYHEVYLNDIDWPQYDSIFMIWHDSLQTLCNQITTNIKDLIVTKNNTLIYPNPTNGIFTIRQASTFNRLQIFSINGQLVIEKEIIPSNTTTINISEKPNGIYFIKVFSESDVSIQKIIKN